MQLSILYVNKKQVNNRIKSNSPHCKQHHQLQQSMTKQPAYSATELNSTNSLSIVGNH